MPVRQNNISVFSKAISTELHCLAMVISLLTIVCAVFTGVTVRGRYLVLANFCMGNAKMKHTAWEREEKESTGCETCLAFWHSQGCIIGWRRCDATRSYPTPLAPADITGNHWSEDASSFPRVGLC